jgi:hypothetical protein
MSSFIGESLPDTLRHRLGPEQAMERADRAVVICSVDEHGWPHPAMLSSLEIVAVDSRNMRLAIHTRSRTARNLLANGRLTVIVADEEAVYYLKGDARGLEPGADTPELARFNLRIDSVLQDAAGEYEHARIVAGIRVTRDALDPAVARRRLDALIS